jgi:type II secretory pathway component PulC
MSTLMRVELLIPLIAQLVVVVGANAQTLRDTTKQTAQSREPVAEPRLAFEREAFSYPLAGRRDPFKPLAGEDALAPLYEDLVLRGIVWSSVQSQSVVLLNDGGRKLYKLRVGESVGNARIVAIEKDHVRLAVTSFGITRQETMKKAPRKTMADLKAQRQELAQPMETDIVRLQQELLRSLRQPRDSTATSPPTRRDTTASKPGTRPESAG